MSDEIHNAGNKGYILLAGFTTLLLFVILVVGIYKANMVGVPVVVR